MTSVANDYGYNNMFVKWLEGHKKRLGRQKKIMVIGLSCSGGSKNVTSALYWAQMNGYMTVMISGQSANVLPDGINEVCLNTQYFHTTEVLTLIMFYELIAACGAKCPTIHEEVVRKSVTQPLTRPLDE
jgi:D-sedoheptulose 7-phosphate isomerase